MRTAAQDTTFTKESVTLGRNMYVFCTELQIIAMKDVPESYRFLSYVFSRVI